MTHSNWNAVSLSFSYATKWICLCNYCVWNKVSLVELEHNIIVIAVKIMTLKVILTVKIDGSFWQNCVFCQKKSKAYSNYDCQNDAVFWQNNVIMSDDTFFVCHNNWSSSDIMSLELWFQHIKWIQFIWQNNAILSDKTFHFDLHNHIISSDIMGLEKCVWLSKWYDFIRQKDVILSDLVIFLSGGIMSVGEKLTNSVIVIF